MPTDDSLNDMAMKIAGCSFDALSPDHRAIVMKLAILADISSDTQKIADFITDESAGLGTLGYDVHQIGLWFEKSKLFDGIPT